MIKKIRLASAGDHRVIQRNLILQQTAMIYVYQYGLCVFTEKSIKDFISRRAQALADTKADDLLGQ